jgi:hypothetical protein
MEDTDMTEEALPTTIDPNAAEEILPKVALELASELSSPEDIIGRYGLTTAQFGKLARTPRFKTLYREAKAYWQSDSNARERIKAKSQHLVENALLEIASITHNRTLPAASRIDSFKTLAKMAAVDGSRDEKGVDMGSRIQISINLGNEPSEKVVVDAPVVAADGGSIDELDV